MSEYTIDFTFDSASKTPDFWAALEPELARDYDTDRFIGGAVIFDGNDNALGVRVFAVVGPNGEDPEFPHGDDFDVPTYVGEWAKEAGATYVMTFNRRPHETARGPIMPMLEDTHVMDVFGWGAEDNEFDYRGHLYTNGAAHGLGLNAMNTTVQEMLEKEGFSVDGMPHGIPLPLQPPSVDDLLRRIEAALGEPDKPKRKNPLDLPDTRPDVPPAFYN